jgi:hypothetical protein
MLPLATTADAHWDALTVAPESGSEHDLPLMGDMAA